MIKCNVTVCGTVCRQAQMRANKEGKQFISFGIRSEEHTSELQSRANPYLVCRLLELRHFSLCQFSCKLDGSVIYIDRKSVV